MNRSSLRLCVSIALVGSALMACVSATDSASENGESTGRTQQALRNCPDGPCDPPPPPPKKPPPPAPTNPPPPPLATGNWNGGNLPVMQQDQSFTFECKGNGLGTIPGPAPECWNITGCVPSPAEKTIPDGGHCGGYTYVSRYLCPRLGTYPVCDPYGTTCTCS